MDTIPPTPVYNLEKIQTRNIGWLYSVGDIVNSDLDKIETAIQTGGGTTNYDALSNRPQINSHLLTGNQTSAQLDLLGVSEAQTITNKSIDVTANMVTNIDGNNFKVRAADTGKVWGINQFGGTEPVSMPVSLHAHYIHISTPNYRITCTLMANSTTAFTSTSLPAYLYEHGLNGSMFNEACLTANGIRNGNTGYVVFGISSSSGSSINVFRMDNAGDVMTDSDIITTMIDIVI